MMRNKKKQVNYLDYVFIKNPVFTWREKDGLVCVIVEWKGFFHWVAYKVLKKPRKSEIVMDGLGSFVWKQLDGNRNLYQISRLVKEEFGSKAEPVYERLIQFVEIMRDNKFILLKKEK